MREQDVDLVRSTGWTSKQLQEQLSKRLDALTPGDALRLQAPGANEDERATPYVAVRR
jgi:hypothetical protein